MRLFLNIYPFGLLPSRILGDNGCWVFNSGMKNASYQNIRFSLINSLLMLVLFLNTSCIAENSHFVSQEEDRINQINSVIMCPVCPGESIDQSQNQIASDMRAIVKDLVKQGRTEDEIKDYFVGKYGPVILLEPSTEGISIYVWLVPPIALIFAMIAVGLAVYVMRKRQKNTPLNMTHGLAGEVISNEEKEKYFSVVNKISNE
ncbi:MAG TPA: cytochrome c-type biogenesis protein CcmH [Dehalococcoidia bacterium]|jgi:cytochrome c-type biogenesis protein CcmH|nr:cytochrome c-type biogenesis protein CcmH [Dehalococcoidia bacterium]